MAVCDRDTIEFEVQRCALYRKLELKLPADQFKLP